jgi:hypothetical protein
VICAAIRAQRIWRRLFKGNAVGLVAQLLQVAHQRLQACDVAAVSIEYPPRPGVKDGCVDWRTVAIVLSGSVRRATLLSAGH